MPPVDDVPGSPRWSARAPVRTPDIAEDEHDDWAEPPRGLMVPILVAVCVLLLVALLGLGSLADLRLPPVRHARHYSDGAERDSAGDHRVPRPPRPHHDDPAARPRSRLPNVRGLDYETAAAELTKLGFIPVRRDEINGEVPKGKVVGTDPPVGTPVLTGTQDQHHRVAGTPGCHHTPGRPDPSPPRLTSHRQRTRSPTSGSLPAT